MYFYLEAYLILLAYLMSFASLSLIFPFYKYNNSKLDDGQEYRRFVDVSPELQENSCFYAIINKEGAEEAVRGPFKGSGT